MRSLRPGEVKSVPWPCSHSAQGAGLGRALPGPKALQHWTVAAGCFPKGRVALLTFYQVKIAWALIVEMWPMYSEFFSEQFKYSYLKYFLMPLIQYMIINVADWYVLGLLFFSKTVEKMSYNMMIWSFKWIGKMQLSLKRNFLFSLLAGCCYSEYAFTITWKIGSHSMELYFLILHGYFLECV